MKFFAIHWMIVLVYAFSSIANANNTIVLKEDSKDYFLNKNHIEVFEDTSSKLSIKDVSSDQFSSKFNRIPKEYPENQREFSSYWIRFKVKSENPQTDWLLELYNHHYVAIFELYSPLPGGGFKLNKTGDNLPFHQRTINHINFEFLLPEISTEEKIYYIRIIPEKKLRLRFLVRSYVRFANYALTEYYLLGICYGMMLIIALYNLLLFPRLKDISYLYYAIYGFFVSLLSMAQDGTGFQYFWPDHPEWNNYAFFTFSTFIGFFLLLYSKSFLDTKSQLPTLHKIINYYIIIRLIYFLVTILFFPSLLSMIWIDLLPFVLAYIASIQAYRKNNDSALYFIIGFTILFSGFLVNTLRIFKLIPPGIFSVYYINVSVIIEMILLSQALTEKVKKLKANEALKESINKELEQKVKERTEALVIQNNIIQEKVKILDNFIYKASHDIKGPLKSLIGVATIGLKDDKENAPVYFEHTLKTARKLDAILKDLLHISKLNNEPGPQTEIIFTDLIVDILESLKSFPGYEQMKYEINVNTKENYHAEYSLIYSIFQNIIENAIKYRNKDLPECWLKINITNDHQLWVIKFEDNGIGIDPAYHKQVFDMFFKIENTTEDSTGLGLYIVNIAVEKLGGQVAVESEAGKGSIFTVMLKRTPSKKLSQIRKE